MLCYILAYVLASFQLCQFIESWLKDCLRQVVSKYWAVSCLHPFDMFIIQTAVPATLNCRKASIDATSAPRFKRTSSYKNTAELLKIFNAISSQKTFSTFSKKFLFQKAVFEWNFPRNFHISRKLLLQNNIINDLI